MRVMKIFLLVLTFGFSYALFGQSAFDAVRIVQDEMGFNARALAMGGAFTGLADDYSALYWNPAGLALIRKSQLMGEISHLNYSNDASFASNLTSQSQSATRLTALGVALPLPTTRGSLVFALGYHRVKDFDQILEFSGFNPRSNGLAFDIEDDNGVVQTYPFDRDVYQKEVVTDDGSLHQWSFGGAIALSPNFNMGLSLDIWGGRDDYFFSFYQEDRNNVYNLYPADFYSYRLNQNIQARYKAVGLKLGGMFQVVPGIQLGTTIGLPVTFTVKETYSENDELTFDDGYVDAVEYEPGEWEYKVQTPFYFDGGISLSNKTITLAGSFRYRDWSQTKFKVDDQYLTDPEYQSLLEENQYIRDNFEATLDYRLGGEIFLKDFNTKLRAGYQIFHSPIKGATAEMNKKFFSAGVGFVLDQYVTLNISAVRGSWKQESEDSYTPGGTLEDISFSKFLFGITYNF